MEAASSFVLVKAIERRSELAQGCRVGRGQVEARVGAPPASSEGQVKSSQKTGGNVTAASVPEDKPRDYLFIKATEGRHVPEGAVVGVSATAEMTRRDVLGFHWLVMKALADGLC